MTSTCNPAKNLVYCTSSSQPLDSFIVTVDNAYNQTVFIGRTTPKGIVVFNVYDTGHYQIKVTAENFISPRSAFRWVTLSPDKSSTMYFSFNPMCCIQKRTFYLTDHHYHGLPISKGEITLCHAPII